MIAPLHSLITLLSQEEAEDEGLEIEGETDNSLITNFHIPSHVYTSSISSV